MRRVLIVLLSILSLTILFSCNKKKEVKIFTNDVNVEFTSGGLKLNNVTLNTNYEYTLKSNVAYLREDLDNSYNFRLTTADDIAYAEGNSMVTKGAESVRRTLKDFTPYEDMLYFRANNGTACKAYLEVEPRKENKHTFVYLLVNKNIDRVNIDLSKDKYYKALLKYKGVLDYPVSLKVNGLSLDVKSHKFVINPKGIQIDDNCLIAFKPINKFSSEVESLDTPFKKTQKWSYYKYKGLYIKINNKLDIKSIIRG